MATEYWPTVYANNAFIANISICHYLLFAFNICNEMTNLQKYLFYVGNISNEIPTLQKYFQCYFYVSEMDFFFYIGAIMEKSKYSNVRTNFMSIFSQVSHICQDIYPIVFTKFTSKKINKPTQICRIYYNRLNITVRYLLPVTLN